MDWLTDHKIPVGKVAKTIFDWMKDNLSPLFDAISAMMDAMIDGHPLGPANATPAGHHRGLRRADLVSAAQLEDLPWGSPRLPVHPEPGLLGRRPPKA
jgi:hypothetical protein